MTEQILYILLYALAIFIAWMIAPVRDFLKRLRAELFTISGGYVWLLADTKSDLDTIVMFGYSWKQMNPVLTASGVILGAIGIVISGIEKSKVTSFLVLEAELEQSRKKVEATRRDYFELCSTTIKYCFKEFFDSAGGQGRVSLYRYIDDHFVLVGREAQNPLHGKRGRPKYPVNEGFIAKGWSSSPFIDSGIPVWKGNGSSYRAYMKKACSITDDVLTKMNMHSTSFYVYRFNNTDAGKPYGIIVFEKMDPSPIPSTVIDPAFARHHDQIVALLKGMKSLG